MKMDLKDVLKQVRKIELINRVLVNNMLQGAYLSRFRGQGMEFADVREYVEGDDVRNIDWNITARTTVPHIKLFQEERERTLMILLDASGSVDFGTINHSKRRLAVEFTASLAFSAIKNHDRVGLVIFTDRIEHYCLPNKGRAHVMRMIRDMIYFEPKSRKTDLNCGLEFLSHIIKKKCTAFLISDFLSDIDFEEKLRLANFRHDVFAAILTDRREREMPNVGIVELEDPETGKRAVIDTGSRRARRQFKQLAEAHRQKLEDLLGRCKTDLVYLDTSRSFVDAIVSFFRRARRRKIR
ncbi:MAG: DUF58 domain-containing protein [Candidatus Firestonebacteria bacterium]|nr:DUF58 domain-containing protein [Candidatus Firestonebacteria bacterium]